MDAITEKYNSIIKSIANYQNGDVVESMNKLGLVYKMNYGVAIPEIEKLAENYKQYHEIAEYLWNQEIRETKLLALRFFSNSINKEKYFDIIKEGIVNSELAEQSVCSYFLFIDNPTKIAHNLVKNTNEYCKLAGLILISKIAQTDKKADNLIFKQLLDELKSLQICHSFHLKRGLARALLQIGLRNNELKKETINFIECNFETNGQDRNWFENEVTYYLTN